jgi:hypothetical protein
MQSQYRTVSNFGSNAYTKVDNPWTSCLGSTMDQRFTHGGSATQIGQGCKNCQLYTAQYCSEGWDKYCEIASTNCDVMQPNMQAKCIGSSCSAYAQTSGDILIRNTAERKYLVETSGCVMKYQPFDPNVATSPNVFWWDNACNSRCIMSFAVDPATIDKDIVMNKILAKPSIAPDILRNIYRTMKKKGTLASLAGTRIGHYFMMTHGSL